MPHRLGIHAAVRYPADPRALFVLVFASVVGLALILGAPEPGSMDALMPHWAVKGWGALLTIGSLLTLAGTTHQSTLAVILEQIGSVMVGVAAILYSASALLVIGFEAAFPVGITSGFGFALLWRWAQLQVLLGQQKRIIDSLSSSES